MWKSLWLTLLALSLFPASVEALTIKNVRSTCGPFGAAQPDTKFLPRDVVFLQYDIEGIKIDAETGLAQYVVAFEVFDGANNSIFKDKETPNQVVASLGGTSLPGTAHVVVGSEQKPGKYYVKVTVTDRASKESDTIRYDFEVLPPAFGLVRPVVPAVALTHPMEFHFGVVGMGRDKKDKMPNVEVTTRILDMKSGAPTLKKAVNVLNIPKDLPPEINVKTQDLIGVPVPVFFNRPGRFIVEVEAVDRVDKATAKLRFPVTVLDFSAASK